MEKIILAIILLNVVISILAKRKKRQGKRPAPGTLDTKPGAATRSLEQQPEHVPPDKATERAPGVGKNLFKEVAEELGLNLDISRDLNSSEENEEVKPGMRETNREFQEEVTEELPLESDSFPEENQDAEFQPSKKAAPSQPKLDKESKSSDRHDRSLNIRRYFQGARPLKEAVAFKTILDPPVSLKSRSFNSRRRPFPRD